MIARRQFFLFGAIFLVVLTTLILVYFLLMRANFVPLFQDLRESDASAIVTELDKQGIEYKLANGGQDILVPEGETGQARLALAGSNISLGGVVGFELFNESDMGLTEFAQKINYQRALQGELARTIMMMDGVEYARVHLALPERSIFKAAQSQPTAAVTIQTVGQKAMAQERVAGIQQLVASAVPDLTLGRVAILDDKGDLLSPVLTEEMASGPANDEKSALEQYFRARAQSTIEQLIPGLHSEIRVFATKNAPLVDVAATPSAENDPGTAKSSRDDRDFRLRVLVRTAAALGEEDNALLRSSIIEALSLRPDSGDTLEFEIGPIGFTPGMSPALPADTANKSGATIPPVSIEPSQPSWLEYVFNRWFLLGMAIAAIVGLLLWRQRPKLSEDEQQSFADLLSEGIIKQQAARSAE